MLQHEIKTRCRRRDQSNPTYQSTKCISDSTTCVLTSILFHRGCSSLLPVLFYRCLSKRISVSPAPFSFLALVNTRIPHRYISAPAAEETTTVLDYRISGLFIAASPSHRCVDSPFVTGAQSETVVETGNRILYLWNISTKIENTRLYTHTHTRTRTRARTRTRTRTRTYTFFIHILIHGIAILKKKKTSRNYLIFRFLFS